MPCDKALFGGESLATLLPRLRAQAARLEPGAILEIEAPDPEAGIGRYAGEAIETADGRAPLHRSWQSWVTLAGLLGCRMLTPERLDGYRLRIRYQKLDRGSFHERGRKLDPTERYGNRSEFSRIHKLEEPAFYWYFADALDRVAIAERRSILGLGINRGDEFEAIRRIVGDERFARMRLRGVDHCPSALEEARRRFLANAIRLDLQDINQLEAEENGRYDLILSVGTLQSPGVKTQPLVMRLVQELLAPDGAIVLGFPNARWIDGELLYGAKAPNYPFSELSLLIKDIHWIKKYLQQHRFRVTITGREYLFLTATPIGRKPS